MAHRCEPIIIVGAGPTGLVLALRLRRLGVPFRIIDEHDGPGEESRALVIHARTLEFYAQIGLADRLIAAGTRVENLRLREAGEDVASISLREMGEGLSPYPYVLCLPQDEHERLLVDAVSQSGVTVEWGTRLDRLEPGTDAVDVALSKKDATQERATFAYVAGCDGARSRVRAGIGAEFGGGTYDRLYYVADVKPSRAPGPDLIIALDRGNFGLMLPARHGETERIIGYVPQDRERHASFEDVRHDAERLLGVDVEEVNWFSTYRVHHRVASRFRSGRCFLLGDAGHLHSPVGGQGMNTGIGDAVNLSWKLAAALADDASPALLDSYEPERITFARSLVATTDRAFEIVSSEGFFGRVFRSWLMPHGLPTMAHFGAGRRTIFGVLSQIRVAYPHSPLSEGRAGGIAGGDRLPWVPAADNFRSLTGLDWQIHGFGDLAKPVLEAADALGLSVRTFAWTEAAERAGFRRGAGYLVRPDAYVALAFDGDAELLRTYVARVGLRHADGSVAQGPSDGA